MDRTLIRLRTGFLIAFAVCVALIWVYEINWAQPRRRCLEMHNWWDPATRTCGHVVYIPDLTHRPPGVRSSSLTSR